MDSCDKCRCPENLGHNEGCPNHPTATNIDDAEWERGYIAGFNTAYPMDNYELSHTRHSKAYKFGYREGRDLIDSMSDDEAQSRCFG